MNSRNANFHLARSPEGWAFGVARQNVQYSDFTKSTQYGTLTMTQKIPAGSIVQGVYVYVLEAFNGGTINLVIGKSSGEDEFTYGTTINVGTTGIKTEEPEAGERHISTETTIYLRIDEGSDWDDVTAGKMCVEVAFLTVDQGLGRGYVSRNAF